MEGEEEFSKKKNQIKDFCDTVYFKGWEIYVAIFFNVRVMTVVFGIQSDFE